MPRGLLVAAIVLAMLGGPGAAKAPKADARPIVKSKCGGDPMHNCHPHRRLFYDEPYVYIRYYDRPPCGWVFDRYGRNLWKCR